MVAAVAHQLGLHGVIAPAASELGETLAPFEQRLLATQLPVQVGDGEDWDGLPDDPRHPILRIVRASGERAVTSCRSSPMGDFGHVSLFLGAGISIAKPAGSPLFAEVRDACAKRAGVDPTEWPPDDRRRVLFDNAIPEVFLKLS